METEAAKKEVERFLETQRNYDKYMEAMARALQQMPYSEWIKRQAVVSQRAEGE